MREGVSERMNDAPLGVYPHRHSAALRGGEAGVDNPTALPWARKS